MCDSSAWRESAAILAKKAMMLFACSYSDWYGVLPESRRRDAQILVARKGSLNERIIERHFCGAAVRDLLAMPFHSRPSRMGIPIQMWVGFDLRVGTPGITDPAQSWEATLALASEIRGEGLRSLVEEYDAAGNYHVWILPMLGCLSEWEDAPLPRTTEKWAQGLLQRVSLDRSSLASALPLPGRHHTADHWSRFWTGASWAQGREAVNLLLAWEPIPVTQFGQIVGAAT